MSTKAANYLDQLDNARCDGNWAAVPELVRKVRKHAPARECLTLTAETECAIANVTNASSSAEGHHARPPTATAKNLNVTDRLPKLLSAIEAETSHPEDKFQAQTCVGWLHWVVAEYSLATVRLPKGLDQGDSPLDPSSTTSEWTNVCALKGAYIKANCMMRNYQRQDALTAFQSGIPSLSRVWAGRGVRKQLRYWAELFLTEYCMLASQAIQQDETSLEDPNCLACYRSWARFWAIMSPSVTGGNGFKGSVPRRRVWGEYYLALSRILEDDLPFPTGYVDKIHSDMSARSQLRMELKNVETAYHALLLTETTFPRADEERAEVESFVKLVFTNWSILCGRGWREQDLGAGGRNSLSRGVLDTLYNAALKTYHSTSILRCLFLLHLSLAEFDLAFKSFDSYMAIVTKSKARVDKTGHPEPSLDDDGIVLQTMAQCVLALCRYGHRQAIQRARQLGAKLEDWLSKLPQTKTAENGTLLIPENENTSELHSQVAPQIIALAWQAIGLAHAHWSRVTSDASSRTEVQSKAIRCLRRSLASEFGRSKDVRGFFALGLLLAERRELTAAVEVTRSALIMGKGQDQDYNLLYGQCWQERSLIPMWHLLALLLSARQDYVSAARACEGALEQFKDPAVLFGTADPNYRSEHLSDAETKEQSTEARKGLVDDMDDSEKESILEVKMTQLALVELLEGPEVAVNASFELLTLFSRLFGNVSVQLQPTLRPAQTKEPPKTSGTLRSIRGSIFGGRDRSRPPTRQQSIVSISEKSATQPPRPATTQTTSTMAPTIHVTEEDGQSRRGSMLSTQRSSSLRRNSLKKRSRSVGRKRPFSAGAPSHQPSIVDGEPFFTPATEGDQGDFFTFASKTQPHRMSSFSGGPTKPSLNSYLSTTSKTSEYSELAADDVHSSAELIPLIQFSKDKERMQRTATLVRVWLMIAGFYRRASMYDDCEGAIGEAQKCVRSLESDAVKETSGSPGTNALGWAEAKSVEDLWGDIWSELGLLSVAKAQPYAARAEFESALTHSPDHPNATVGLSNILLDIYSEDLLPIPAIPPVEGANMPMAFSDQAPLEMPDKDTLEAAPKTLPFRPLGLGPSPIAQLTPKTTDNESSESGDLPAPYKARCLPLTDRLAARDRAYALLSGLTRLGSGWNYSEAWFALARAHEESGQPDKAKEVLWWCVELEEAMGVREWASLGGGGYTI